MMTLRKNITNSSHNKIVVLMPEVKPHTHIIVPPGSVGSGRTWRTPEGRTITFTTPKETIPEGPFELLLSGWGQQHKCDLSPWRDAASG